MVTTAKNEHKCSISAVVGGWAMGYHGGGSQRKPTTAEIERLCSVLVVVGGVDGLLLLWQPEKAHNRRN